ncbi:MAG: hypothetical protein GY870_15385 [archaeon]|nr:hypothetical protein [archaeon]
MRQKLETTIDLNGELIVSAKRNVDWLIEEVEIHLDEKFESMKCNKVNAIKCLNSGKIFIKHPIIDTDDYIWLKLSEIYDKYPFLLEE